MLQLKQIVKNYGEGDNVVQALKGVDLDFRKSEFVSVLGPSGCGKTTLLNIIGGLDRYTSGDLVISGKSTKDFKASDWDAYRNHSVGFVFQSYNLIPHLTVLGNVELALTLSGVSAAERKRRAAEALEKVGLKDQTAKHPNQLSGGQMQRVAIARAIVNDPEILLADEPTGALDSNTSVQIMDLLKEIAAERLIIMVTHNGEIAETYSTRIIRLLDGEIVDDTDPFCAEAEAAGSPKELSGAESVAPVEADSKQAKRRLRETKKRTRKERNKTSMSFFTALNLSMRNLVTKKGRTFMTSFAGSIGIIGVALVLAISNGFSGYISNMQSNTLSGMPITISQESNTQDLMNMMQNPDMEKYPDSDKILAYVNPMTDSSNKHVNLIDDNYLDYVNKIDESLVSSMAFTKSVDMNILLKTSVGLYSYLNSATVDDMGIGNISSYWQEIFDKNLFEEQYEPLAGKYPESKEDVVLVIDKYNRLSASFFQVLGMNVAGGDQIDANEIVGTKLKLVLNDEYYEYNSDPDSTFQYNIKKDQKKLKTMYETENSNLVTLNVVGVVREKRDVTGVFSSGFAYSSKLMDFVFENAANSDATKAQMEAGQTKAVVEVSSKFINDPNEVTDLQYKKLMQRLGADDTPAYISIYPKNFEAKEKIKTYLSAYNDGKEEAEKILFNDLAEIMTSSMGQMVDIISYVLIAFAAISLVVSSIMIGIITYVSVIERTKEIGVLRSIGARKKDISRVFNAETLIIGFAAGLIGVIVSALLTIPINMIIVHLSGISGIASLNPLHGLILIAISMCLTLIAGLIPSRVAAKKDPVVALRTE